MIAGSLKDILPLSHHLLQPITAKKTIFQGENISTAKIE